MVRSAAVVFVMLCLSPATVAAQGSELTISAASASVHKSPSTASPVIGRAVRGTTLEVMREVGDWVRVAWPSAADGVGYVRVSNGSLARIGGSASRPVASASASRTAVAPSARPATSVSADPSQSTEQPAGRLPASAAAPSHVFGVGARLGGTSFGVGASVRGWSRGRLGVQFDVSRYELTNPIDLGSMTSTQIGSSALYAFDDHVSDYTWLRPYVGAGLTIHRSTLNSPILGLAQSDSALGFQAFGGGELTFAGLPQLGVSAELGYHWFETPFAGFEVGGIGLGIAGHWYIK